MHALEEDFWAAADLHCEAFYPNAGFLMAPLIKLDRTVSIIDGNNFMKAERGRWSARSAILSHQFYLTGYQKVGLREACSENRLQSSRRDSRNSAILD